MTNPLTLLPPQLRATAYVALGLVALGLGAWRAADGDVIEAVMLFLASLGFGTAVSNTQITGGEDT